jgi:hypothetical protein
VTELELALERLGVGGLVRSVEVPPHNSALSAGVYILTLGDGTRAVLKHLTSEQPAGEPWSTHWRFRSDEKTHWNYWLRESLCYERGLTTAFRSGGVAAPELIASRADRDEALLLVSLVGGVPGDVFSLEQLGDTARRLAVAQASYLCGRPLPSQPWLSRDFLHDYSTEKPVSWDLLEDKACWDHEMAASFPPDLREKAVFLHAHASRLYAINQSLPPVLSHLDFWPKNLIAAESGLVLLDWGSIGRGAIGEDAGNLIPDSVLDHFVPAAQLEELEEMVIEGYVTGLREAGWEGDRRLVELGIYSSCVKYDWLTPFTLSQLDQVSHRAYGNSGEVEAHFRLHERGIVLSRLGSWAERSILLASELGI